jgi:hypothetical protein
LTKYGQLLIWGFDPSSDAELRVPTGLPDLPLGELFVQVSASMTELVAVSDKNTLWRLRNGIWEELQKVLENNFLGRPA